MESEKAAAGLDKVTDHVEDSSVGVDAEEELKAAMEEYTASEKQKKKAAIMHNLSLARVTLDPKDVDVLASEFALPKAAAEHALKEAKGDLEAALRSLVAAGNVVGVAMTRSQVAAVSKAAVMKDSSAKPSF